jgi:Ca2+-binding EF-hand superfamily protein
MYVAKLKEDFKKMDVDGNGVVTREDLLQKAKDIQYFLCEEELESTIQSLDEDGDGKISLEEFVACAVRRRVHLD